jgi:stage III sporulation protein AA
MKSWQSTILPILPPRLRELFGRLDGQAAAELEEIRLRVGQTPLLQTGRGEQSLSLAAPVRGEDLQAVLLLMSEYSLYARDEELRRGYLSLPGGHRAGFTGRVVAEEGRVKLMRDISGIAIRIAREIRGAGEPLLSRVYCSRSRQVRHTLLVSPPQAGKTTMLRDLARLLSDGDSARGRPGFKVGMVDERSELAGCYRGEPQLDVGRRTDVLDGCPKAEGMMMLIRSMSPQVVVTDELGRAEDVRAVEEVINAGAAVLATAHGRNVEELLRRPSLACLLKQGLFERVVVLSRRQGPGTIEGLYTGEELRKKITAGGMADAV